MAQKKLESPYFQPEQSVQVLKRKLIAHLDLLKMPVSLPTHGDECARNCHIIERNHTLEAIRHFVTTVDNAL